jgi:DNA-directed RNA polymerase sigma subunit (sigma70/sigma32)
MLGTDNTERDAKICARRDAGLTYMAIGHEFGISHERVRQIVAAWERKQKRAKSLAPLRATFEKWRRLQNRKGQEPDND